MPLFGTPNRRAMAETYFKEAMSRIVALHISSDDLTEGNVSPKIAYGLDGSSVEKAISSDPTYLPAHHLRGLLNLSTHQFEHAEKEFRDLVSNPETDSFASAGVMPDRWSEYTLALISAARAGKLDSVLDECDSVLSLNPQFTSNIKQIAGSLGASDMPEASEKLYKKALNHDPRDMEAYIGLSIALAGQDKNAEAEGMLVRVLNSNPNNSRIHYYLGMCRMKTGKLQQSARDFEFAMHGGLDPDEAEGAQKFYESVKQRIALESRASTEPDAGRPFYQAALEALSRGDDNKAFACLREALKLEPNTKGSADYYALTGTIMFSHKKFDEAESFCRLAISRNNNHTMAHYGLGSLLGRKGMVKECIAEYNAALANETDIRKRLEIYSSMSKAYQKLGDIQSAQYFASLKE